MQPVPLPKLKDGFLDGTSSTYLEELEERFRDDPSSVDKTWASFFNNLGAQACARNAKSVSATVRSVLNSPSRDNQKSSASACKAQRNSAQL